MRGRVMALYMMIFMGGTPLGAPVVGWVGEEFGARWTLIGGGGVTIAGALLAALLFTRARARTLAGAETLEDERRPSPELV
jgi:MFS family permease